MSIIIQTGHYSSKSELLMQKLYERGLSHPLNSFNHKLTPQEVARTIHKILSRNDASVTKNKLADNIMVDLLLSNLNSEYWGWESEKNLLALDNWCELDSSTRFILVFDHPDKLLLQVNFQSLTVDELGQIISNWINYHQNMLSFLEKNKDKAILVEGAYAIKNINNTCKKIENIFQNISFKGSSQILDNSAISKSHIDFTENKEFETTKNHLFTSILCKYPLMIQLFNNLLDKSSMSYSNSICETEKIDIADLVSTLNYITKNNKYNMNEATKNKLLLKEIDKLNKEKYKIENEFSRMKGLLEDAKKDILKLKVEKETNEAGINNNIELKKENEMIIAQLHYVQEELEKIHLRKENISYLDKEILSNSITDHPVYYGAAERVKQDLPYRLGATMIKKGKTAKGLAVLPLSLAKEYKNFKKEYSELNILPCLEDYQDAYEGERVRNHLSYKLGNTLVEGLGHPLRAVKIPYKSFKHIRDFKKK